MLGCAPLLVQCADRHVDAYTYADLADAKPLVVACIFVLTAPKLRPGSCAHTPPLSWQPSAASWPSSALYSGEAHH